MAWHIMTTDKENYATYFANKVTFAGDLLFMEDVYRIHGSTSYFTHHPSYVVKGIRYHGYERKGEWFKNDNSTRDPELRTVTINLEGVRNELK